MWSSGQDLAFSPPWPGFDSRHGKFTAMSILLHHQVGHKKPVSNAIVRHHFLQLQTSKLCPVRRLHNFNNNCNVVLLSTSKTRVTAPMWSSGQDLALSPPWPGFDSRYGKFTAIWCDFLLRQKIREMVHSVYKPSIFVEFNAKNLVSSGAGNILTIILIQLLCCWAENFSLLERNENFRKERFNFTASVYYPRFDFV